MKGVRVCVYDWSGVISDDRLPIYTAQMRIMRAHDRPALTFEEWSRHPAHTAPLFMRAHGLEGTDSYLMNLFRTTLDEVSKEGCVPQMYPGVDDVVTSIKKRGKQVVVLSSHPSQNVQREAQRYGVSAMLDDVRAGITDKVAGLQGICHAYCVEPREILFVGDTTNDIKSGKAAGVRTGGVCTGYHSREQLSGEGPDHLLDTLHDLLRLF